MKSSNLHVSKRRRTYTRLLGEIQHALLEALEEERRGRGLTRAEIARIIGRDKSFVTRKLNGQSNMTLESLADLAFALDRPVKVRLPSRAVAAGSNHVEVRPITSSMPETARSGDLPPVSATTSHDGINAVAA
jgi:transcriptional regulator with XRE-family HTH domain